MGTKNEKQNQKSKFNFLVLSKSTILCEYEFLLKLSRLPMPLKNDWKIEYHSLTGH